jgi:hypothetical protein
VEPVLTMCGIRIEATIGRFKQMIGADTDQRRAAEVDVAVHALERKRGFQAHLGRA